LRVHVDLTSLGRFGGQLDRAANRLAMGIVTAALVVGSSIVMTVDGLPFFGAAGFVGALVTGAWLVVSIVRSGGGR
jgi:ubiquinone biosynthesis protein